VQIIRKNFTLKVLAVTLAIVGWAYVRFATNPVVATARFDQQLSVPITTVNLTSGYVAHFTDREAVVTVAPRRGDAAIKPDEIKAVLDLAGKGAGVYNVSVALVAPQIVVQSLSPASVTLTIEKVESRDFPLAVHYIGDLKNVVVAGTQMRPSVVTIQGTTTTLEQVAAVHADVTLPDQPHAVDEMVRPVPVNAAGNEILGLQVAPDLIRVRLRLTPGTGQTAPR
jgi:YbbR domain-containing protein